jgi:hypothetical protein
MRVREIIHSGFLILLTGLLVFLSGCGKKKPTALEGFGAIKVKIGFDITARTFIDPDTMRIDSVEVTWLDVYGRKSKHPYYTNSEGEVVLDSLFSSKYKIDALRVYGFGEGKRIKFSGSMENVATVSMGEIPTCEINLRYVATGIKINEIYFDGPSTNELYFDDQYIELYNPEDDTLYLDGMVIYRVSANLLSQEPYQPWGQDNDGDGDIDKAISGGQFPGTPLTGRQWPIAPGQFVVCACTPIDHRQYCPTSIDLSHADFEFFNPLCTRDADYPGIPNITELYQGRTTIFMLSLGSDVYVLTDGSDLNYLDGIDISSVVDGVEYRSSVPAIMKYLTPLVDQGYAGIGIQKYNGLSIERIIPGYDTNNSTNDFEIIIHPTPGYQHTSADVWQPSIDTKIINLNFHRIK